MKLKLAAVSILLLFTFSFKPSSLPPVDRKARFIDSLLQLMTLEEKIGQMTLFTSDWDVTGPTVKGNYKEDIRTGKMGAIFNAYTVKFNRELQKIAVDETRLHIPLMFGYDVIHGHRTIFPIPLGESASWDLQAIERSARIAATEASAEGLNWTFAPMVDIARDPRWGRVAEGAGEDTYLGSLIAAARVKGFQSDDLSKPNTIAACVKHYAAYGAAQGGRDYNTVDMSESTLREEYLPPFKACADAGAATFMTSFNEINGVPSSGNPFLLKQVLKKEWNFQGLVVTDYTSINEMVPHGFAADDKQAGEEALNAGVDMDMQGAVYYNYLKQSLQEGKVTLDEIDDAVKRILGVKYDLGLFADPYRYLNEKREATEIMTKENREAARDMARKSIVLLKNENQLLPLKKSGTIALIGPLANDKRNMLGNWSAAGDWQKSVSVMEGFKNKIGSAATILYSKGANILEDKALIKKLNEQGGDLVQDTKSPEQLIADAVATANKADVVVMVLGESVGMSGEAASRSNIGIPENQVALLKAVHATGKPVVLVLINGRPLTLSWENDSINSIVEAWFPGTEAGNAIADVVFGDYNPAAKLTISFPRNVGQIPVYYNMKNTGRPFDENSKYTSKYLDVANSPLYPFGYGLSYTTFDYSNLKLGKSQFNMSGSLNISVTVTNSGKREGEEVVQLYVRDLVGSVTRPVKELKGFRKISLKAGESKNVSFTLISRDLAFYTYSMEYKAEPGKFQVFVGGSSATGLNDFFELVK